MSDSFTQHQLRMLLTKHCAEKARELEMLTADQMRASGMLRDAGDPDAVNQAIGVIDAFMRGGYFALFFFDMGDAHEALTGAEEPMVAYATTGPEPITRHAVRVFLDSGVTPAPDANEQAGRVLFGAFMARWLHKARLPGTGYAFLCFAREAPSAPSFYISNARRADIQRVLVGWLEHRAGKASA